MNLLEMLAEDFARAAAMTMPQLEAALEERESKTVSELTALSLAKRAAEGGMDAIKLMKELSRSDPEEVDSGHRFEIRIVGENDGK